MIIKTLSSTSRYIVVFLCLFLLLPLAYVFYLNKSIPLNTKPDDTSMAKRLTKAIASSSDCTRLEYDRNIKGSYLVSTCYKSDLEGGSYKDASFSIVAFITDAAKDELEQKLISEHEMYLRGQYYIVHENTFFGDSKSNEKRVKQKHAYADFQGEIVEN